MTPDYFGHLLSLMRPRIEKQDTTFRKSIPAEARLALTLRLLASGESQQPLSYSYRIGRATVSNSVSETCEAISDSLKDLYLKPQRAQKNGRQFQRNLKRFGTFPMFSEP